MLLSTETHSLRTRFGEEKAFVMLKNAGFDACDFSFYQEGSALLGEDYMQNAIRTKAVLDRVGLLCNQAHAPFDVVEGDPFDLSCPSYKAVVRAIEYAAYIGAKIIVVHAICTANRENVYRYNQEYYKSLEPYGRKFGIRIAVENDFERRDGKVLPVLNHPEEFGRFVEELGSDWLVGCIDIGHAAMFHDPAEFLASTKGDVVRALHVHDNDRIEDLHLFPMTGYVDWDRLCRSLKQIGYTGDLTMEAIKSFARIPDELMQDSVDYLAKIGRYFMDRIGE